MRAAFQFNVPRQRAICTLGTNVSSCGDVFNVTTQCNTDGDTQLLMPKIVLSAVILTTTDGTNAGVGTGIVALFLRYLLISNYETDKGPPLINLITTQISHLQNPSEYSGIEQSPKKDPAVSYCKPWMRDTVKSQ